MKPKNKKIEDEIHNQKEEETIEVYNRFKELQNIYQEKF